MVVNWVVLSGLKPEKLGTTISTVLVAPVVELTRFAGVTVVALKILPSPS